MRENPDQFQDQTDEFQKLGWHEDPKRLGLQPRRPTHGQIALAAIPASLSGALLAVLFFFTADWSNRYAVGIFCLIPMLTGFLGVLCLGKRADPTVGQTCLLTIYSLTYIALAMLVFRIEGMICLLMAAPLAIPLGMLGGGFGVVVMKWMTGKFGKGSTYAIFPCLLLAVLVAAKQTPTPRDRRRDHFDRHRRSRVKDLADAVQNGPHRRPSLGDVSGWHRPSGCHQVLRRLGRIATRVRSLHRNHAGKNHRRYPESSPPI